MKVREPVARPVDVVAVELLLSGSQAFLVGVLMYLAIGVWDDRGLGQGPVAIILAMLGLAVGAAWAYWLMGGVGWPLAAANVPGSMFLGFALVLGWSGSDLFALTGVPLLLATLAAIYGIVGGAFIESPRRWRWDQREKPRAGAAVPRISPTTRKVVASIPRSLPRPVPPPPPTSDLAARIEQSTPPGPPPSGTVGIPYVDGDARPDGVVATDPRRESVVSVPVESGPEDQPPREAAGRLDEAEVVPAMPTERLSGSRPVATPAGRAADDEDGSGGLVLPTSVEPRAQRSPWAWAAPPDWNRDEDDDGASRSSGKP